MKTKLVFHRLMVTRYTAPGCMAVGDVAYGRSRQRILTMPSWMSELSPLGYTSVSLAVKSVSVALLETQRVTDKGPVMAIGATSTSV